MRLENKAIVVTGASSGMGKAIVELFVKEGASVVAVARRTDRLAALAESLAGEPGRIVPFTGDVSRREDCEAMIDACVSEFGRLDVLVNNAGIMDNMPPPRTSRTRSTRALWRSMCTGLWRRPGKP